MGVCFLVLLFYKWSFRRYTELNWPRFCFCRIRISYPLSISLVFSSFSFPNFKHPIKNQKRWKTVKPKENLGLDEEVQKQQHAYSKRKLNKFRTETRQNFFWASFLGKTGRVLSWWGYLLSHPKAPGHLCESNGRSEEVKCSSTGEWKAFLWLSHWIYSASECKQQAA